MSALAPSAASSTRNGLRWVLLAVAAYAGLAALAMRPGGWREHFGTFLLLQAASWLAALGASRTRLSLGVILGGAALFRLLFLSLAPELSGDIYRYVWEGRVQGAGFDPYRFPPLAADLAPLRDGVWHQVNHPQYGAIYPPLAQLVFRLLANLGGVTVFKSAFVLLDLATCALLGWGLQRRGEPAARLALYAWSPLAVIEVAASGHLEPLGILPLVAAVLLLPGRRTLGWGLLAASVVAKYAAAVTLPAMVRSAPPRGRALAVAAAVAVAAWIPFAGAGSHLFDSLRVYAEHWRYNDILFALVQVPFDEPRHARTAALLLTGTACVAIAVWRASLERRVLAALATALALSPTIHPWYLLWPLAFVPLAPSPGVIAWSGTITFAYLHLFPAFGFGPLAKEAWGPRLVQIGSVLLALAIVRARRPRASVRDTALAVPELASATRGAGSPSQRIVVVIPALDEELSLPLVLSDLAPFASVGAVPRLDEVIVVDNGSRDRTPDVARAAGATLLDEPRRGYGGACQRALTHLRQHPPDIVVFMDADRSDDSSDLPALLGPILEDGCDLVIGSRTRGEREPGALLPQARFGNWLATGWIRARYGFQYTDLGPFRAIRWPALERLAMADQDWGWTLEMQVRALQEGLRVTEVPVRYRKRVGRSKISGTLLGSVRAGRKILWTMWKLRGAGAAAQRKATT